MIRIISISVSLTYNLNHSICSILNKWVILFLITDGGFSHVSRINLRLIRQYQQFFPDGMHQIRHTAVWKIRPSYRCLEQGVPTENYVFRFYIIAASAFRMSRCMNHPKFISCKGEALSILHRLCLRKYIPLRLGS